MKNKTLILLLLGIILCVSVSTKGVLKDEEIEVKLQFLEYELEDLCILKNEAEWKFLNGTSPNLKKLLDVELKESNFYKYELSALQKQIGRKFSSKKLQRLVDLFTHAGAPLLGDMEFKEYRDYSVKLQEIIATMKIECVNENSSLSDEKEASNFNESETEKNCTSLNYSNMKKFLYMEKNERKLKETWIKWYRELEEKNKKTKYDFVQQLSILDLEAEQNGDEELMEYWLRQSDVTSVNYETLKGLWKEIVPLYNQLIKFMKSLIVEKYGESVLLDRKLIPTHLMGSLHTHDWVTAAEKLGAFDHSAVYKAIKSSLKARRVEDIYRMADNLTAELKLGNLPHSFYEKSRFNESSQYCQNKRMDYCERENILRVMHCADELINLKYYITVNENVMKIKYLILSGKEEEENGYLFREGPRDSALYEAMGVFAAVRALSLESLQNQKLLPAETSQKQKIFTLLINALNVIPSLPYYLASDVWRINALEKIDAAVGENVDSSTMASVSSTSPIQQDIDKRQILREKTQHSNVNQTASNESIMEEINSMHNLTGDLNDEPKTYDTQNLTRDWWSFRESFQLIGSPDGKPYEDYLQDEQIIWSKPYLSKFLGTILQFQILEYLKTENGTENALNLQSLMQKGKSKPWQTLAEEIFNITEISAQPLLKYFKPLEEFLEKGIVSKNHTRIFSLDDFDFLSQGFSLSPVNNEEGERPAEGSDALFFSLAVVAAVGVVAVIVTVGRRRYQRRQRARERKRRLAEFN